jgi:imidazoleglycerol phosphate synthase glutamine amidotransferase subunit HisH
VSVAVCDYGAGNVRSVLASLRRLGAEARSTRDPSEVLVADLVVLPGVGSAASAMAGLREAGLDETLRTRVAAGGRTLGICLGLQLALEESEEDGGVPGLALLPGRAVRLREGRIPRIGWARVEQIGAAAAKRTPLGVFARPESARADSGLAPSWAQVEPGGEPFYFAHSFEAETPAATAHSEGVVAAAEAGSFLGVQFHPEKSGPAGARFLARCLSRV